MGLRRLAGVDRARFLEETGFDMDALCGAEIERLSRLGMIEDDGRRVRLSDRALVVRDAVFAALV